MKNKKLIQSARKADVNSLIAIIDSPKGLYSVFVTFLGFRVYEYWGNETWVYFGSFRDDLIRFRPFKGLRIGKGSVNQRFLFIQSGWHFSGDKLIHAA